MRQGGTDGNSLFLRLTVQLAKCVKKVGQPFPYRLCSEHLYEARLPLHLEAERLDHGHSKFGDRSNESSHVSAKDAVSLRRSDSLTRPAISGTTEHAQCSQQIAVLPISERNFATSRCRIERAHRSGVDDKDPFLKIALLEQQLA